MCKNIEDLETNIRDLLIMSLIRPQEFNASIMCSKVLQWSPCSRGCHCLPLAGSRTGECHAVHAAQEDDAHRELLHKVLLNFAFHRRSFKSPVCPKSPPCPPGSCSEALKGQGRSGQGRGACSDTPIADLIWAKSV